jgi:hypothetical protein
MSEQSVPGDTDTTGDEANWRSTLPEEIREDKTLGKYESVDALAAAHINLQSHLGREKIAKPVTESDWDGVYNFLGRPEEANGYEIELPEDMPDEVKATFSEERLTSFKDTAHKLGLNPSQVAGLAKWQQEQLVNDHTTYSTARNEMTDQGETALREEWGKAYDQNARHAGEAFVKYGGDELGQVMDETGIGNHPAVLRAFANIAKATMSDTELHGNRPENKDNVTLTPEEAKEQASELMAHPAYTDRKHPEHNALVKRVSQIFQRAYD